MSKFAVISLVRSKRDEVRGTVLISRTHNYLYYNYALIVELSGIFEARQHKEISVSTSSRSDKELSTTYCLPNPRKHQFWSTSQKSFPTPLPSPDLIKYTFHLPIPQNVHLPPNFDCSLGKVSYFLRVLAQHNKHPNILRELTSKEIHYPGQGIVNPGNGPPTEKDIDLDGVKISVQVPRTDFIIGEIIPCTISGQFGEKKGSLKNVTVWLTRIISYTSDKILISTTEIVHCKTFKRFLKRERFTRSVKFATAKVKIHTIKMEDEPKLRIRYLIQVRVTTLNGKSDAVQIDVALRIGLPDSTPWLPRESDHSAPSDEGALNEVETPTAPRMRVGSLVGSMMSLFPPSYSTLPSRAVSMVSLETLPPSYDDI